jgi:hypothetical protein
MAVTTKPKPPPPPPAETNNPNFMYFEVDEVKKYSETLQVILNLLSSNNQKLENSYEKDEHLNNYLTLESISSEIRNSDLILENGKTLNAINEALQKFINAEDEGKRKLGLMYPILSAEGNRIKSKIILISPQTLNVLSAMPYREQCFSASIPVIDGILSKDVQLGQDSTEPESFKNILLPLFSPNNYEEIVFNPYALSYDKEITLYYQSSFTPLNPIVIKEFSDDFLNYTKEKGKLLSIAPNYIVLKDEFVLDKTGVLEKEPDLIKHFRAFIEVLHTLVTIYLHAKSLELKLMDIDALITDYRVKYNDQITNHPEIEKDRIKALNNIITKFPSHNSLSDKDKKLLEGMREGNKFLISLTKHTLKLKQDAKDTFIKNCIKKFSDRITEGSKSKKILQIVRMNKLPEVEPIIVEALAKEVENEILNYIIRNLGHYEESTDNKKVYQVVDPAYFSAVLNKHIELKNTGATGEKQYNYVRKIQEQLESSYLGSKIDTGISPKDLAEIRKNLDAFDEKEHQERIKQEKSDRFSSRVAYISGLFIFLVIFTIYQVTKLKVVLILSIPISITGAFILGKAYRKNKDPLPDNLSSSRPKSQRKELPSNNPYYRIIESLLFPTSYNSLKERIHTHKKIRNVITENIKAIKLKSNNILKGMSDDQIISKIESAVLEQCSTISIPKEFIPKTEPKLYIFSERDIKNPLMKMKIIDYFKKVSEKSNPPDKKIHKYYNYIVEELNKL